MIEVGSRNLNGSLRSVMPAGWTYTGVDFEPGHGVDVVLDDPYVLPFADASIDVVVSSSCFEHAEFFWLSFLEIVRVLRPAGLLYLNVPSNGDFHRHPVDCWRFYPDSGHALQNWARRNGYQTVLLEGFTGLRDVEPWADTVLIFIKDGAHADRFPGRIQDHFTQLSNGMTNRDDRLFNPQKVSVDQRGGAEMTRRLVSQISGRLKRILRVKSGGVR